MLRWNFQKRKYERVEDRFGLDSMCIDDLFSTDKVKVLQEVCANCGTRFNNENNHISLQWKDDMEFICKVCDGCHEAELAEQAKHRVNPKRQQIESV